MTAREKNIKKDFYKPKLSIIEDNHFYVFQREFPICDVAQGLNGDPLNLCKGNPHV